MRREVTTHFMSRFLMTIGHRATDWFGFEGTFKDHLVTTALLWAGTLSSRPSCSKPHPI